MGETAAMRLVGYYNELAGFIDSYYPGRGVREDVNSGEKSGARVALLIQPSENVSITPRIVYQKLETDGYPRIDVYNILGNPFTTTQPAVNPASAARSRRSAKASTTSSSSPICAWNSASAD